MQSTRKLTYDELRAGMEPFLHFAEVEDAMRKEKDQRIRDAEVSTVDVRDESGSAHDIVAMLSVGTTSAFEDRLKLLLTTTQGSLEALDRVCMVLCPQQTTWAQRRGSNSAKTRIAEFLMDPTVGNAIPWYTAERFRLPSDWVKQIRRFRDAEIHSSLQSLYSTKIGHALEARIVNVVEKAGFDWEKGRVTFVDDKEVDVVVPALDRPRVLIMSSYYLTTSSAQSQRAREQKAMHDNVRHYNSGRSRVREPDVQLINIVDGAGWIRRNRDLEQMHQHCDYALSFGQLFLLPEILRFHLGQ